MKWLWFHIAAVVTFFSLVLHGVPVLPVAVGIAAAALLNYFRRRKAGAA